MRTVILIIMVFIASEIYSQSKMRLLISELTISNFKINLHDEIYDEDETDGPFIYLKCVLNNNSDTNINLFPSKANIYMSFRYNGLDYIVNTETRPFTNIDSLLIFPKEQVCFYIGSNFLLGTPIWDEKREDYSQVLLKIIPTVKIHYKGEDVNLFSTQILNVHLSLDGARMF